LGKLVSGDESWVLQMTQKLNISFQDQERVNVKSEVRSTLLLFWYQGNYLLHICFWKTNFQASNLPWYFELFMAEHVTKK